MVLRSPEDISRSGNPRYEGLYRSPHWSQEKFEQGFDDPYVFGDSTNEAGLVRSLELARQVQHRFAQIESPEMLEIIYARTRERTSVPPSPGPGLGFLGFDVACYAPFWSIVADWPSDARAEDFAAQLNQHGLFESIEDAQEYLDVYRARWLTDAEQSVVLHLWQVYLVE